MIDTPDDAREVNRPQIDRARMADLGAYTAVVAVDADGSEALWLVVDTDDGVDGCCCAACAPHEQVGRPSRYRCGSAR